MSQILSLENDAPAFATERRGFLKSGAAITALATVAAAVATAPASAASDKYADPAEPMLPPSNMKLDLVRTALVVIDPQVDFLSPKGVAWGAVGESIRPTFKPESSSGT
jgi:hypothetical protein